MSDFTNFRSTIRFGKGVVVKESVIQEFRDAGRGERRDVREKFPSNSDSSIPRDFKLPDSTYTKKIESDEELSDQFHKWVNIITDPKATTVSKINAKNWLIKYKKKLGLTKFRSLMPQDIYQKKDEEYKKKGSVFWYDWQ